MIQDPSKHTLSFELANQMVSAHCQVALQSLQVIKGGYFASVYAATLENGLKVIIKTTPEDQFNMTYEKHLIYAEYAALQLLAREQLSVPKVIAFDASRQFLEHPFLLLEFIEGITYDKVKATLPAESQAEIEQKIGQMLQKIHRIKGTGFGAIAPDAVRFTTWREAFLTMLHSVLEDGQKKNVPLPCNPDLLEQQILEVAGVLEIVTEPQLVLFDLWDGNVMIKDNHLSGIFDLERALWADPLLEYQWKTFAPNPDFLVGYGTNLLLEPTAPLRRSLYNLFLSLIMVIECTYRQYPTPDFEIWARGELQKALEKSVELRKVTSANPIVR
jgi:aminoglycoside phosphotransferase (APT) family kinase protein